jgi:hypothetical protein
VEGVTAKFKPDFLPGSLGAHAFAPQLDLISALF